MSHTSDVGAHPAAATTSIKAGVACEPGHICLNRDGKRREHAVAVGHVVIGLEVLIIVREVSVLVQLITECVMVTVDDLLISKSMGQLPLLV